MRSQGYSRLRLQNTTRLYKRHPKIAIPHESRRNDDNATFTCESHSKISRRTQPRILIQLLCCRPLGTYCRILCANCIKSRLSSPWGDCVWLSNVKSSGGIRRGCLNSPECYCKHGICIWKERWRSMWKERTMFDANGRRDGKQWNLQMEGMTGIRLNMRTEGAWEARKLRSEGTMWKKRVMRK